MWQQKHCLITGSKSISGHCQATVVGARSLPLVQEASPVQELLRTLTKPILWQSTYPLQVLLGSFWERKGSRDLWLFLCECHAITATRCTLRLPTAKACKNSLQHTSNALQAPSGIPLARYYHMALENTPAVHLDPYQRVSLSSC